MPPPPKKKFQNTKTKLKPKVETSNRKQKKYRQECITQTIQHNEAFILSEMYGTFILVPF